MESIVAMRKITFALYLLFISQTSLAGNFNTCQAIYQRQMRERAEPIKQRMASTYSSMHSVGNFCRDVSPLILVGVGILLELGGGAVAACQCLHIARLNSDLKAQSTYYCPEIEFLQQLSLFPRDSFLLSDVLKRFFSSKSINKTYGNDIRVAYDIVKLAIENAITCQDPNAPMRLRDIKHALADSSLESILMERHLYDRSATSGK